MIAPQTLRVRADEVLELHEAGQLDAALGAAEALLDAASSSPLDDPVVRESVFAARFERALVLTELGDLAAAADAYALAATTPADRDDPDQRHEVAMALLNRGICLDTTGAHDEALTTYDELIAAFRDADDPVTADQVVRARVNRAAGLLAVDRAAEALTAADALVGELDPADALEAEQLAMAVRLRAAALRTLDRADEAAAALAEVERCVVDEPAAHSQVVAAQRERAQILAELGHVEEALALLEATLARLEEATDDPTLEELVEELEDTRRTLVSVGHEQ